MMGNLRAAHARRRQDSTIALQVERGRPAGTVNPATFSAE